MSFWFEFIRAKLTWLRHKLGTEYVRSMCRFVLHQAFAGVRMRYDDRLIIGAGQQVFAGGIPGNGVHATFVDFQLIEEVHAL